ncbi:hypothetical protein K8R20_01000 [bacterium]|nr:hypothetical protein [bacterium]
MKKLVIYTTLGTILVISGVFITSTVSAQELDLTKNFFGRIAQELDVDEKELVEIVQDVREDMFTQRQAERVETITQALEDGKFTEKQAEILSVMEDLDLSGKPENMEEWREYTHEQREALREARREARSQDILEALYDEGLEVTQEELDNLHDVMVELGVGIRGVRGQGGARGLGKGTGKRLYR